MEISQREMNPAVSSSVLFLGGGVILVTDDTWLNSPGAFRQFNNLTYLKLCYSSNFHVGL